MFNYIWPLVLAVASNTIYQICAKSVPETMNPFASLVVTYFIGAVASMIIYLVTNKEANLLNELLKVNWAPFVLGLVVVCLEVAFIYAYKAGWQVSVIQVVQSCFLAIALMFVGKLVYNEPLTLNKIVGLVVCLIGLAIVNYK